MRLEDMHREKFIRRIWYVVTFVLFVSADLPAQSFVVMDVGIRTGITATNSHQLVPACCGAGSVLGGIYFFAPEAMHSTIGPTIGLIFRDRVEARFEAVRRRYSYRIENQRGALPFLQQSIETTQGHFWQHALLASYRPGHGTTRPFIGGGFDPGAEGTFKSDFQYTTTSQLTGGDPVTTITFSHREGSSTLSSAFYIIGGVDARLHQISIRPELRYQRFLNVEGGGSLTTAGLQPNQLEFLVGISVQLFRRD